MNDARGLLLYGTHAVRATLQHASEDVLEMWLRQGTLSADLQTLQTLAMAAGLKVQTCTIETLDKLAQGGAHQGVVVRRRAPRQRELEAFLADQAWGARLPLLVLLDQVQDPHNLGALLRVADAAGADGVVLTRDRTVGVTATVAKVASGALETVPLLSVANLARAMTGLKEAGFWLAGASHAASASLYETDLARPLAWVFGAEGTGLRRLTRDSCDFLLQIPMAGTVASLNLSTAAAVCLFETQRQRAATRA